MIRIPKRFYDDHIERDLPAPKVSKTTKAHYYIPADQTDELSELLSDAEFYSDRDHFTDPYLLGICTSAQATAKAIKST